MRGTVAILTLTLSLCLCFASNQSQAAPGPAIDSAIPQPDSSETVNTGSESPRPEHPLRTDAQSPAPMESAPERKADPRAERGLTSMSNQFVPRGQWIFGASASYSTHTNKDYTFLVIEDINSDGYTFKVTPLIAYAIRDNMAIGVKFIYSRSLLRIDSGSIKLGSDIDLGVDFYNALQHNYSGAFIWRQYIPLGQNKRFALFNETSLTLGGGQSRFAADSPIRGTYETNFSRLDRHIARPGSLRHQQRSFRSQCRRNGSFLHPDTPGTQPGNRRKANFEPDEFQSQYPVDRAGYISLSITRKYDETTDFYHTDSRRNGFHAPSPGTDIPGGNSVFPLAGQPVHRFGCKSPPRHKRTSGPDVLRRSERLVHIDADHGFPGTPETTIPADETANRP